MSAHKPIPASASPVAGNLAGASPSPSIGVPATLSLTKLLDDASRFERATSNEAELEYLCNIAENLLRARPGMYAEEVLKAFRADLECALENDAEDRRFLAPERLPNGGIAL